MAKQFKLFISHLDAHIMGSAEIDLPAGQYALLDALEKARIGEMDALLLEIAACRCDELQEAFDYRSHPMDNTKDVLTLNAVARKMESMSQRELEIVGGLIRMEKNPAEIPMERFYDIMHSVECCHYVDVSNDTGLGKFYVENGFVPETENLPDNVLPLLDFEKIGQNMREAEHGVYLAEGMGYVVRHSNLIEAHKNLHLSTNEPDYTVLMEVGVPDSGETVMLKLPMPQTTLESLPGRFGAQSLYDLTWRCADCRISALADAFSTWGNLEEINEAARALHELSGQRLSTYKAMLEAVGFNDLADAVELADALDEYVLTPAYTSPYDVGVDRLCTSLSKEEVELLTPHVNLYAYGEKIMEKYNMRLTDYGVLERKDGQPIQTRAELAAQERGGMEMM